MNLQSIGDQDLLQKTESLAYQERRIGADLLRHLRELDNIYAAIEVLGPRQMQPYLKHRP